MRVRPEVSSERERERESHASGSGTMAGASRGKKGPIVASVARTSPEEKLFLVRRAVCFSFPFSSHVTEKGNSGSDTQAVICRLLGPSFDAGICRMEGRPASRRGPGEPAARWLENHSVVCFFPAPMMGCCESFAAVKAA